MRLKLILLALIAGLVLIVGLGVGLRINAHPGTVAQQFVLALQKSDIDGAKALFEGPRWRGGPPEWLGGDDAYFRYESGYEPNVAFLRKQSFTLDEPEILKRYKSDFCLIRMFCTEAAAVALTLHFDTKTSQAPMLLPPSMAFAMGYQTITRSMLADFINNPGPGSHDQFTVRLRPTVKPGLIEPMKMKYIDAPLPEDIAGNIAPHRIAIPDEHTMGFTNRPVDALPVLDEEGTPMTAEAVEAMLPRLKSITMRFHITRHEQLEPWRISFFTFTRAVVRSGDKDVTITLDQSDY